MLTVKFIDRGREQVIQATNVEAEPAPDLGAGCVRVRAWVAPGMPAVEFSGSGSIYVMNDAGRTVANYRLGSSSKEKKHG